MLAGALGYVRRINPDGLGGILLCLGAILLSGTNMFGIVPMVAVAVGLTGHGVWNRLHLPLKGKIIAFATATIVAVFVAYYLLIRFAPWHKHDDYQGAVAEAVRVSSGGGIVWWVADHSGGAYYGLPLAETITGAPGEIQFSMNRQEIPEQLPAAIILSRLDNFDTKGDVRRILAAGSYKKTRTLQTFEIWEK